MKTMLRDRRLRFVILALLALGCVIIPFALQVEERLFVLDAHQGTLLHSISLPKSAQKSAQTAAQAKAQKSVQTKVIAGDRLFVETTTQRADHRFDWELTLIDIRSGQQQWRFTSPLTPSRLWDAVVPVYVGEKTVYVSLDNGQAHDQLYAIDIATGQPRWQIERAWKDPDAEYSFSRFDLHNSGQIGAVEVGDRLVLLTPNDEGKVFLQTLDQATGKLIQQSDISDWATINPIGGVNYALLKGDRTLTLWRDQSSARTYDLASGKSRFTLTGEWIHLTPVGSTLYAANNQAIQAVDESTGQTRWRYRPSAQSTANPPRSQTIMSLQATAQAVYVLLLYDQEQGGSLDALDPQTGQLQWSVPISATGLYTDPTGMADGLVVKNWQSGGSVRAIAPQDGSQQWQFPRHPPSQFSVSSVFAYDNGRVSFIAFAPRWQYWLMRSPAV